MDVTIVARLRDEVTGPIRRVTSALDSARGSVRTLSNDTRRDTAVISAALGKNESTFRALGQTAALQMSGLRQSINDESGRMQGALGRVSAATLGPLAAMRSMGTVGAVALGTAGVAAVGFGLSTAAAMQNARVSFETMLGSAEKADAFLAEMKSFAAKTPFEFSELQTAASSLISIGVEAKDVIPIMNTLGNVTSGMGTGQEGIKRATVALQQMNAAGKIQAEDLNQLRDAGIPVYDLLAAATGKSKQAIAEMVDKGKLGRKELDQLMEALKTGEGFERFEGLMEKQSKTLGGLFSTLKDTVAMGLADVFMPVVPVLEGIVPRAAEIATQKFQVLASALSALVRGEPAVVGEQLAKLFGLGEGAEARFTGIANALGLLPELFTAIGSGNGNGVAEIIDNMFGNTGNLAPVIRDLIDVAQSLGTIFRDLIWPVLQNVLIIVLGVGAALLNVLNPVLQYLADNAESLRPTLYGIVAAFAAMMIITTVTTAVTALKAAFVFFTGPIGAILLLIAAVVAIVVLLWNNFEGFRAFMIEALRILVLTFIGFAESVVTAADIAFGWIPGLGGKLDTAKTAIQGFRDKTNEAIDGIKDKYVNVGVDVKGAWSLSSDPGRAQAVMASEAKRDANRARRAGGGVIYGPGGPTDDAIPAYLSNGEYVIRAEAVKRAGVPFLDWVNAGRFAGGGFIANTSGFTAQASRPGALAAQGVEEVAGDAVERIAKAVAPKIKNALTAMVGGPGLAGQPMGVQQMMAIINGEYGPTRLISGYRPGAITATGKPSYHGKGRAVDLPPSMPLFEFLRGRFPNARELIFSPAGFRQVNNGRPHFYSGITRANHFDHIHLAMKRGGLVGRALQALGGRIFDKGGWLRSGQAAVSNLPASRREAIMPEDVMVGAIRREMATAGGGGMVVEPGGITVIVESPRAEIDVAAAVAAGIRDYERERRERR